MVRAEGDRALAAVVSEMTRNPDPGTVHHGILTVVTGSDAEVPGPVLDRLLKFYRRAIIAGVGREAPGHPGQEPDPRLAMRGRPWRSARQPPLTRCTCGSRRCYLGGLTDRDAFAGTASVRGPGLTLAAGTFAAGR